MISDYKKIDGWLSKKEAKALFNTAALLPHGASIVEIGVWKGKSTYCLARGLKEGKLHAIDPFDASGEAESQKIYIKQKGEKPLFDQFEDNMKKYGVWEKIRPLVGLSEKHIDVCEAIDLLFIDGDHSIKACRFDFENFAIKIPVGGYLLFHDYDPERPELGPTWVIENLVIPSKEFDHIQTAGSIWIGKRHVPHGNH